MENIPERIEQSRERLKAITATCEELVVRAENEKRDLSEEETSQIDDLQAEFQQVERTIDQLEELSRQKQRLTVSAGRKTQPDQLVPDDGDDPEADHQRLARRTRNGVVGRHIEPVPDPHKGKAGFRSLGHFALDVVESRKLGHMSDRLRHWSQLAATTYGQEGVGADGGFAVPPDFRNEVMTLVSGENTLLGRTMQQVSSGNTYTFPADETTAWGTTGIYASWESEGDAFAQRKPALQQRSLRLHKLGVLVPLTDELLEDAPAMDGYLRRVVPERINFKVNLALVQGTGVGQPAGVLNAPCAVSVAKESSQIADSIIALNIIKMWSRMFADYRADAVWLINQDVEPQLHALSLPGKDNEGNFVAGWGVPVYMPAGGLSGSPFATLYGRPVIPTQACETLGDLGDIIFWAPNQYITVQKVGGTRADTSIHLYFDQDITAFRFVLRLAGAPLLSNSISARDGSTTYSSVVTLAERA